MFSSLTGKDEGQKQARPPAAGDNQRVGDASGGEDEGRGAGVAPHHRQEMGGLPKELHPGTVKMLSIKSSVLPMESDVIRSLSYVHIHLYCTQSVSQFSFSNTDSILKIVEALDLDIVCFQNASWIKCPSL